MKSKKILSTNSKMKGEKKMSFKSWLREEMGIEWNTFEENYSFSSGQGKALYDEYCEDMEQREVPGNMITRQREIEK